MKTLHCFILIASAAVFAGCATMAPTELVNARSAYQTASEGPAKEFVPAELHKAHDALNLAEQSFQKEPDSFKTKDLAYAAQRKSEQASALGSTAAFRATKERANADYQLKQAQIVKQGKIDLSESEKRTADAQAELVRQSEIKVAKAKADADFQMQQAAIAQGKKDLNDAERRSAKEKADAELLRQQADTQQAKQDLKASEKKTADALASLASIAALKEEERGLVLTLSGSILFRSADSNLLPAAREKLDQVAKALLAIRTRNLIVEGHTDSQGSDSYNQSLSQRRADAVRNYLVQSGYPADHIQSRGQGEGSPIASNSSAEGRANNRRVEIVIEREKQAAKQ